jgi:hypothetical protein
MPFGRALSEFAMLKVRRLLALAQPRLEARSQFHAMPEKDFFDCGTASFYNCRVLKTSEIGVVAA